MERKELIKEIDRVLAVIDRYYLSRNNKYGLCEILNFSYLGEINADMVSYAKTMGIYKSNYWWSKYKWDTTKDWYAPRIAFLESWKTYLIHGEKTLFEDGKIVVNG